MRVTLFAYLPSVLLITLAHLGSHTAANAHDEAMLNGAGAVLLFPATAVVVIYWLVRLVRHAWRG